MSDVIVQLLEDLRSDWQEDVRGATHALAALGEEAITPLLRAIQEGEIAFRRNAALVLKQMHAREALPPLIALLDDPTTPLENREVLLDVLVSLMQPQAHQNDTELLDLLLFFSRDEESKIRKLALVGLGKIGTPDVLPMLRYLQQDPDEGIRHEAQRILQAMKEAKPVGIPPLEASTLAAAARLQERAQQLLMQTPPEGVSGWPGVILNLLPSLREAGSATLAEMTPLLRQIRHDASQPLKEIVLTPQNQLERRLIALQTLEQIHDDTLADLAQMYSDLLHAKEPSLRSRALMGLVKARKNSASQAVIEALHDSEESVRLVAAELLASVLTPQHKEQLRPVLDALHASNQPEIRSALLKALGCLVDGSPADRLLLLELQPFLHSSTAHEAELALQIVKKIGIQPSESLLRELLRLLDGVLDQSLYAVCLALLEESLPSSFEDALRPLARAFYRFPQAALQDRTYALLERLTEEETIDQILEEEKPEKKAVSQD